jgi:hypothetical protein
MKTVQATSVPRFCTRQVADSARIGAISQTAEEPIDAEKSAAVREIPRA